MEVKLTAPWIEKYRPRRLSEVVSHAGIMGAVQKMMSKGELPHLLFYGPPGTGKTTSVLALANEFKCQVLELNAADERGIDVVRDKIKEFVSTQKLSFGVSKSLKLVILDEADALTQPAQMALRRMIELYSLHARFCVVANYIHKIIPALQSRCTRFRFNKLPDQEVAKRIRDIAGAEKLQLLIPALAAILRLSNGDLRKAINTLQSAQLQLSKEKEISEAAIYESVGLAGPAIMKQLYERLKIDDFEKAVTSLKSMIVDEGHALEQLVKGLHECLVADAAKGGSVTSQHELACTLDQLAALEDRLALGASPDLQLFALAAAFQKK